MWALAMMFITRSPEMLGVWALAIGYPMAIEGKIVIVWLLFMNMTRIPVWVDAGSTVFACVLSALHPPEPWMQRNE